MTTTTSSAAAKSASIPSMSMKLMQRAWNFCAGPGCLPDEVIHQVQHDAWDLAGTGIGILEHSHRAKTFDKILEDAETIGKEVGNIPADYHLLFLTGGATTQNAMIPANLLPKGGTADYFNVGYWAQKSIDEVKYFGTAHECASSKASDYSYIPSASETKYSAPPNKPAYVHYTSNNTIYGTEFHYVPTPPAGVPLICDMSSDIYSRPLDVSKFGLIYAGAQKNLGCAGTTVVIIRNDLVEKANRDLPTMMRYSTHAKEHSRYNTPPVFPIYVTGLVFKWIKKQGGLAAMAKRNAEKAKVIYDVLDSSKFFKGHARPDSRSLMNITFRCPTEQLDELFVTEAKKEHMDQLKGHRATGGMRASVYNAFPLEGAKVLADFMKEFERKHG